MSNLNCSEIVASAELVDLHGQSVQIAVDTDLKVYADDKPLTIRPPVSFVLANLLDNIDTPVLNKDYDTRLLCWYSDLRSLHPSLPKCPIESEAGINASQKANAIRTLEKGRTFFPRNNLFSVGYGSRVGSFLFFCSDLTDVNYGAEILAKHNRDSGVSVAQTEADVKFFASEFNRRVKVATRFMNPDDVPAFVKARNMQQLRVASVVARVWTSSGIKTKQKQIESIVCNDNEPNAPVTSYGQKVVDKYVLASNGGECFGVNEIIKWLQGSGINASATDVRSILDTCHSNGLLRCEVVEIDRFGNTVTRFAVVS